MTVLVAVSDIVYAGTGKSCMCLESSYGGTYLEEWSLEQGEGCVATLSLGHSILIGHANWKGLYANNAVNGELLWENKDAELNIVRPLLLGKERISIFFLPVPFLS